MVKTIRSFSEYVDFISKNVKQTDDNPIFYRALSNKKHNQVPSSLRSADKIKKEDSIYYEFQRRRPEMFTHCTNTLEKLVVMQHYGSFSRCLDLTESPLVALAFACIEELKSSSSNNTKKDACITLFRPENPNEDIKTYNSRTVSVIANCAICKETFKYGNLQMKYKSDGFSNDIDNYIFLEDIVRRSVIVRTKQDNPRISNQMGAFILCNANELEEVEVEDANGNAITVDKNKIKLIMEELLRSKPNDQKNNVINLNNIIKGILNIPPNKINEWSFKFKKVNPYSLSNKYDEFKYDPFDLNRLIYAQIIIPHKAKKSIANELRKWGMTYDYLFPEADTVFHEIVKKIK